MDSESSLFHAGRGSTSARRSLRAVVGHPDDALRRVRAKIDSALELMIAQRERGGSVWPSFDHADLADPMKAARARNAVRARGCLVVRKTFSRGQAAAWEEQLSRYIESLGLDCGESQEPILPIYWSPPQRAARAHPRMLEVHQFMASCWSPPLTNYVGVAGPGPYPDRVRRSNHDTRWEGLPPHIDSAAERGWSTDAHYLVYRHVYDGDIYRHDPWSALHRLGGSRPTAPMPAFRAFLGWTTLSQLDGGPGCLHVVPEPAAIAEVLLRALQDDLVDAEPTEGLSFPVVAAYHPTLVSALTSIPPVEPGDTVWWHPDLIHAVPPLTGGQRDISLMYIPFSPQCPTNDAQMGRHRRALENRTSPADFPASALDARDPMWHRAPESPWSSAGSS